MIRKGFVDLPHGQVHFRHAGDGPPVLLLHDSPRSSVMHDELILSLAREFTAIALDTPGYGHSAPLSATPRPEIPDFARTLADTQSALGIERCAIYGFHTSSKILLQFALDHPERVALAIIDGLNLPPGGPGDEFIARYMKPLPLEADGSHLAAGWSRAREFMRFFPWFDATARSRLIRDFPDDDYLHGYALDLLTAGPHFSDAYGAAMRYLATPRVAGLRAPTVVMCRSNDPLYVYLDALPQPLPAGCRIERLGPERTAWETRLIELMREAQPRTVGRLMPSSGKLKNRRTYRDAPGGQWHVREQAGTGRPVILLHETPGSAAGLATLADQLATLGRPILAPDLPGCGESTPVEGLELADYADALAGFIAGVTDEPVDLVAAFTSAPLALLTAVRHPARVRSLVCEGVPLLGPRDRKRLLKQDCPPLPLSRDGTHLIALWHQLRDRELHWPWHERSAAAIRKLTPDLDAQRMHGMTLDVARQIQHYDRLARASWLTDLASLLPAVTQPVLLFKDADDPRLAAAARAKRRLPNAKLIRRPATATEYTVACRAFWTASGP